MDRRQFVRKMVSGAAVTASGLVLLGCEQRGLVREPVSPHFGARRGGPRAYAEASRRATPARTAPEPTRIARASGDWSPPGPERDWQYIILHHSATDHGSAAVFDRLHRAHGWDELGYHFVIGNGTESADGQVEVGSRWPKQKHGAHCKVVGHPEYNDVGIGVCLVGNFDNYLPTGAQAASCVRVVQFLKDRYGIPESRIYGHRQLKPTHCPGALFPYDTIYGGLT
jgi:N-acetyl-anhydromuramyl-L-alanine amidase AmpD